MGFQFQFGAVFARSDLLIEGLWLTLQLAAVGILGGAMLGTLLAMLRSLAPRAVGVLIDCYVELIRNTPFLVQLLIIYFGLPSLGVKLSAEQAALIGLIIYLGAYVTEIMRAGIESVHRSQIEAGLSLAMSRWQVFRHVVLPLIGPSLVGVALFGFTLSWDEIARSSQAIGDTNTLPLELQGLTTTVTTPEIYALGTLTTGVSVVVIGLSFAAIAVWRRLRAVR